MLAPNIDLKYVTVCDNPKILVHLGKAVNHQLRGKINGRKKTASVEVSCLIFESEELITLLFQNCVSCSK